MTTTETASFLATAEPTDAMRGRDAENVGYVMNVSRLWSHQPDLHTGLFKLMGGAAKAASLTFRQRAVLVVACASTVRDAYCSLVWGMKLANAAGVGAAEGVLHGDDSALDPAERALATWARAMAANPNATEARDLEPLRAAGYDDAQILAITVFVAARLAFATVNDALGVLPDETLYEIAPPTVVEAVTYGRRA
jgi:alkylhydroperoxidase family enzyme